MANTSSAPKKATTKPTTTRKKATASTAVKAKKSAPKKRTPAKKHVPDTVDYYPNRMTLAISALAGTLIVLLALIAVLGQS